MITFFLMSKFLGGRLCTYVGIHEKIKYVVITKFNWTPSKILIVFVENNTDTDGLKLSWSSFKVMAQF